MPLHLAAGDPPSEGTYFSVPLASYEDLKSLKLETESWSARLIGEITGLRTDLTSLERANGRQDGQLQGINARLQTLEDYMEQVLGPFILEQREAQAASERPALTQNTPGRLRRLWRALCAFCRGVYCR